MEQQLSNPAIIIIGEVVNHRQKVLEIQKEYNQEKLVLLGKEIV